MVDLETINALALMLYILVLEVDELHPGDEMSTMTILMNARVFLLYI